MASVIYEKAQLLKMEVATMAANMEPGENFVIIHDVGIGATAVLNRQVSSSSASSTRVSAWDLTPRLRDLTKRRKDKLLRSDVIIVSGVISTNIQNAIDFINTDGESCGMKLKPGVSIILQCPVLRERQAEGIIDAVSERLPSAEVVKVI